VKQFKVVKITWLDSESLDSWKTLDELKKDNDPLTCVTIGFLIRTPTKRSPTYFVASTITNPPGDTEIQASCTMKIPKDCVVSIEEINASS
jgi:hypothetical protein